MTKKRSLCLTINIIINITLMANLKDIAAKVGISHTAVSKYLRDPATKHVSAAVKRKIDQAVAACHYRRNVIAGSLSSKKSQIISVLIPYNGPFSRSTFVNELLAGLESVCLNKGYHLLFPATKGEDSATMVKHQITHGYGFDGFVLFATRYCTSADIQQNVAELARTQFPFVVVNSPLLSLEVNQVVFATPAASSAVAFLFAQGHQRIALFLGSPRSPMCEEELQQYRALHAQRGLAVDEQLILYGDYERASAKGSMLEFLRKELAFSAVYCVSDTMALGVYEALKESGLRIPDDISVVGKHDAFFASFLNPPLTTVRVKMFDIGVHAADMLLAAIRHGGQAKKIFLDNELILRASTRVWK